MDGSEFTLGFLGKKMEKERWRPEKNLRGFKSESPFFTQWGFETDQIYHGGQERGLGTEKFLLRLGKKSFGVPDVRKNNPKKEHQKRHNIPGGRGKRNNFKSEQERKTKCSTEKGTWEELFLLEATLTWRKVLSRKRSRRGERGG